MPRAEQRHQNSDAVILALPFTKLRQVKGLDRLNLSREKLNCINKLGMGKNAKIMVGTTSRVSGEPRNATCGCTACRCAPMAASCLILSSKNFGRRAILSSRMGERPAFLRLPGRRNYCRKLKPEVHISAKNATASARYRRRWPTVSTRTHSHVNVLEQLSLHARQLLRRRSRTIHHDV